MSEENPNLMEKFTGVNEDIKKIEEEEKNFSS